jgi:CubicO group peptidase (beta-lactamase class C family)
MRRRSFISGFGCWALTASHSLASQSSHNPFVGAWSGFVDSDDPPTLLTLRVGPDGAAVLTVVGVGDVEVVGLQVSARRLRFKVVNPPLTYAGRLSGGNAIHGSTRRGGREIPLTFIRGDFYTEAPPLVLPPGPPSLQRLRALRLMARAPAMGVGWRRGSDEIRVLVDGLRSAAAAAWVEPADLWHLGSVTKSMTATLAARLVGKGLIDWRTPIGEVLGDRVPDMQPAYRPLNLLHLLSHHGGMARDAPSAASRDAAPADQRLAYGRAALRQPPVGPAERQMAYSNNDYVVAGLMLEAVGHAPWEILVAREVFEPLGVRNFGFGPPGASGSLDQPQGHRMGRFGLEPVRQDVPIALGPAGRVNMNLHDLALYLSAHRDQPAAFLKPDAWRTLHTPPFGGDYALGWQVSDKGVLFHGGTNSFWKSEVRVDAQNGVVCAAVANVLNNNTQSALLQLEDSAERAA